MDPRHAAYSVVAQIGHDSVAVVRPFPLPPSSPFSTLPFSKNRTENFWTNQSRCGLPTASASPGPGTASFQFFQPRYLALTFSSRRDSCNGIIYRIFLSNNNSALGMCLGWRQKFGAIFPSSKGSCYCCWFKCLLSKPWFPLFPPSSFLNFWHRRPLKYVTAPDFNQNFEQNFLRDREQDLGTEEMHLFQTTFWFTRI